LAEKLAEITPGRLQKSFFGNGGAEAIEGALNMHKFGLADSIVSAAQILLRKAPVLCGLAILENALKQIHAIKLVLPEQFIEVEKELLEFAPTLFSKAFAEDSRSGS
jgi:hypothetical protein